MKYVKLFEEYEGEIGLSERPGKDPNPNGIQVGDTVSSYRGMGEVISIDGETAQVKLHTSGQETVSIPLFSLDRVEKERVESHRIRKTQEELSTILNNLRERYAYLENEAEYCEDDEEFESRVNFEKLYELLEETLIEVMAIVKNDASAFSYREYAEVATGFSMLADILVTFAPEYKAKVGVLYSHFPA